MKKKIISVVLVVVDIIILVLFVLFLHYIFLHIFGPDFIEYEDYFGQMDSTIDYRFGAGSAEIAFILIRVIGFIIAQRKLLKEQSKKLLIDFVVVHIVIGILGLIYCFRFADGADLIYNIQWLLDN